MKRHSMGANPIGRLDILLTRIAGTLLAGLERTTGAHGITESLLPKIAELCAEYYGPRQEARP